MCTKLITSDGLGDEPVRWSLENSNPPDGKYAPHDVGKDRSSVIFAWRRCYSIKKCEHENALGMSEDCFETSSNCEAYDTGRGKASQIFGLFDVPSLTVQKGFARTQGLGGLILHKSAREVSPLISLSIKISSCTIIALDEYHTPDECEYKY